VTPARVLVAEDETLIRLDLRRLLEAAGFEVCAEARNGREAVSLAAAHRPDVVLMDVKMPELDGVEAARQILADCAVPIVMLTAYGYGELISRALDVGVVGYVVKPFTERELIAAVRGAIEEAPSAAALAYLHRPPPQSP
jgi:YesN/AraC family two-component response regulator